MEEPVPVEPAGEGGAAQPGGGLEPPSLGKRMPCLVEMHHRRHHHHSW
jgi:hypothetical protein